MIEYLKSLRPGIFGATSKWHKKSEDMVFEVVEETGAGRKVQFYKAYVEIHEETGEKRVRTFSWRSTQFYDDEEWSLATTLSDRSEYSTAVSIGEHQFAFPKDEYIEKVEQDSTAMNTGDDADDRR